MTKITGTILLLVAATGVAMAGTPSSVPEIDLASGMGAFALLSGALLVIRGRRKK